MNGDTAVLAGRVRWTHRAVAMAEATKLRSVVLLTFVGLAAGIYVLFGEVPAAARAGASWRLLLGTLAVLAGSMGTNAITGYVDRRMDAIMSRTRHRPVPSGRLAPEESLGLGVTLVALAVGLTLLTGHPWSTFWLLFGVVDVALIYNGWSKPRTPWNVILGSPGGGAPVMVVASAVSGLAVSTASLLMAALVVAWTPIHVWSLTIRYVDDYRRARVPMLPVVIGVEQAARCVGWSALALCALAAALPRVVHLGPGAAVALALLQAPVLLVSVLVMLRPTAERAWLLFKLSSPYLGALFLLVALRPFM
ncbi:MAG: UbiA family prenyltransferase [Bacillota bacterium]|nr:UbiA family prenyltransferase [Bacillota bacterium]